MKDEEVTTVEARRRKSGKPDASLLPGSEPVGMETGYRILSYIAAGLLFYGGLGWLGDKFLGTSFLLPLGLIIGVVLAMYAIIRRFDQPPETKPKN
ncbi:hypothetical protein GA0111570_10584 [Raineyella antarctica]|uniref:F0F1-ATPase subunit Ca2+/Mg2+ transporter n=1 Tax=Raineyella antarctica TaxID=1577474 RepID=A0A1G6GUI9_9ACTN|nr:hypothetical protein [Raineyella antarctica]SDB85628.1 hypothetical protein GA0111570_10584 [Raineyella antarctica]